TGARSDLAPNCSQSQSGHLPDRLEDDRPAHLGAADLAVDELDRHLDDAEAGAERAVGHLDLEGVALRVDRVEVYRLQHVGAIASEARGQVSDRNGEQDAGIEGPAG